MWVRVVNGTPIQRWFLETTGAGGLVSVAPVNTMHYVVSGVGAVDVADITNHFRTGRQNNWTNLSTFTTIDAHLVIHSATNMHAEMIALLRELKGQHSLNFAPYMVSVNLHGGIPAGQVVPAGFTSAAFGPGDVNSIGSNFFLSVPRGKTTFHSTIEQGLRERASFYFRV